MGRDRSGVGAQRVEVDVEHAVAAGKLELARIALGKIEPRRAEPPHQRAGILPDHAFEPLRPHHLGHHHDAARARGDGIARARRPDLSPAAAGEGKRQRGPHQGAGRRAVGRMRHRARAMLRACREVNAPAPPSTQMLGASAEGG